MRLTFKTWPNGAVVGYEPVRFMEIPSKYDVFIVPGSQRLKDHDVLPAIIQHVKRTIEQLPIRTTVTVEMYDRKERIHMWADAFVKKFKRYI